MGRKFTFLITSLALLLGSSTVWGQQGKGALLSHQNEQVTPRRGDISNPVLNFNKRDTIHGAKDVSVAFGAGESSSINSLKVNWPTIQTTSSLGGTLYPGSLLIGSDYSKNAVAGIYDNNGSATGAVENLILYDENNGRTWGTTPYPAPPTRGVGARVTLSALNYNPAKDAEIIGGPGNGYATIKAAGDAPGNTYSYPLAGNSWGWVMYPYRVTGTNRYQVITWNHIGSVKWSAEDLFVFYSSTADTLYTSTRDDNSKTDNGKPLLYTITGSYETNPGVVGPLFDAKKRRC